ncbi:major facilitator superfamily transporter [Fusarium albosuccineum]|uniref:Major facilitator superfamily transporter n=1 Tax=Fusarium albosuccineum TaxID=1237068 RepID=A0A8H4P910_9HYPO|nr:major facilitator superfamily transporter [Fusarium albosuccineum]
MSTTVTQTQNEAVELTSLEGRLESDAKTGPGEPPFETPSDDVPPPNAQTQVERWNYPKGNVGKLGFAFLSFIIAGMNDAAVGALIPYLETYYDLSYTIVSLIFLTPFAGYSIAAFTNARIHMTFGQRGVAIMAPICHIITFVVLAAHPPYPVLVVCNMISGFGNGLTDACFCAWIGVMDKANTVQGFLHSCYSLGALFAPLIATSMVVSAELPWYTYYYMMIGISVVELVGLTVTFWHKTGEVYRAEHARENSGSEGAGTREALKSKVTWLCSLFFFAYMGVEVGLGGWVVTFMLRVRNASAYASGASGSGFWAGMALGRAGLGFVTERYGERLCLTIYLAICIGLQLLFWLVPQFIVSAVAVAFLGFFLGPMFPGAVMVTAKLLPAKIHVSAIGFAMAMGGTGGTVFPFAIGAIASHKGVAVLQPIILALIAVVAMVWLSFPRIQKKD